MVHSMRISDIDENFKAKSEMCSEAFTWYEQFDGPFHIHGACTTQAAPPFCRMDPDILPIMTEEVRYLAYNTSGMRIRFRSDTTVIALKAKVSDLEEMPHMPLTGSSGFDIYVGAGIAQQFVVCFAPDSGSRLVVGDHNFGSGGMREITINLPLYNGVEYLALGIIKGSSVECAKPYAHAAPIVFYGSSITQGGCASRPGNSYPLILSRMLDADADIINLGFSGSAKGEPAIADYIARLEMGAFVLDYDYNAPSADHLKDTHYRFYQAIRSKHPLMPIVMTSRPDFKASDQEAVVRRSIVLGTYLKAFESGDSNVAFVDGERLFGSHIRDACTVDGCHPNDLGFMRMAETLYAAVFYCLNQ